MTKPTSADHLRHDLDLLVDAADRDVDPAVRVAADAQIAECESCAAIYADLRSLVAELRDLPHEIAAPRDMRLSPVDAARLRDGGWRGFLRRFAPRSAPALLPLASALTTLGVAGILLTTVLGGSALSGASSATGDALNGAGGGMPSAAAAPARLPPPGSPTAAFEAMGSPRVPAGSTVPRPAVSQPTVADAAGSPSDKSTLESGGRSPAAENPQPAPIPWLLLGSALAVVVGLGLLGLRFAASKTR